MNGIKMEKIAICYIKASDKKAKKMLAKANDEEEFLICALVYENKNVLEESIAAMATRKIHDRNMLYTIAIQARDMSARIEIAKNSTDKNLLEAICRYDGSTEYIMSNTKDWARERLKELDKKSVDSITDDNTLAAMVLDVEPSNAYQEILYKISSVDCLIYIAANAAQWYVRKKAYSRISYDTIFTSAQKKAYAEAAIKEKSADVEESIYLHIIKDDALLKQVAQKANMKKVRINAICYLDVADDAFLREMLSANKSQDSIGRGNSDFFDAILGKANTPVLLFEFAKDRSLDWKFRLNCFEKLIKKLLESSAPNSSALCDDIVKFFINETRAGAACSDRICGVYRAIPSELHKKYGFSAEQTENEAEDQYGRHTERHLYVTFEGKKYKVY